MKPLRSLSLSLPLALLALGAALGPARAEDAPLKSLDLLKKVTDAHAKIGPATLKNKIVITSDDRPLGGVVEQVIRRNDAEHVFTITEIKVGRYAAETFHEYVDGKVRVTYNPGDKEYGKTPDEHDIPAECLDAIRSGLLYPEEATDWEKARVKTVKLNDAPCYKVKVKKLGIHHKDHPDPQAVSLAVDPKTFLVREYEVEFKDGLKLIQTTEYQMEAQPFPASTFVFVAPAGAKESGTVKEKKK